MSDVRNSKKQSAARSRARERAAEYRQKQDELEELATGYFIALNSIEEMESAAQNEIAAVHERTEKKSALARTSMTTAIGSMLDLGVARAEVAERLGIPLREVKR
ncbi:hypothetical protein [Cryobacterium sp. W22_MBD10_FK3]|uniref:hypothetical protein n=1 Tax=Cryobacterium sp. W22_MBD10_FK3 TaxID=3240273 RepID=UPI003F910B7A